METQRLILVVGLGLVLFMLWTKWQQQFNPPPVPPAGSSPTTLSPAGDSSSPTVPGVAENEVPQGSGVAPTADAVPGSATGSSKILGKLGQQIMVQTDTVRARIDSIGGTLREVELIKYPVSADTPDQPFILMNDKLPHVFIAQSGFTTQAAGNGDSLLAAPNHTTPYQVSSTHYELMAGRDSVNVDLHWTSDEGVKFTKRYEFKRGSYLIKVDYIIDNTGSKPWRGNLYQQLKRSKEKTKRGLSTLHTYTGGVIWSKDEKYQKINFGDMDDENLKRNIEGGWAAMIQHYFVGAWIPQPKVMFTYYTLPRPNEIYELGMKSTAQTQVAAGSQKELSSGLYVGPKLQHQLAKISEGLDRTVDYGYLTILSKPLFWLLEKIHALVGNWGWSIILLTLMIKLLFYKLSETSYKSMANMRKLTPRLKSLKERYGDDKQKMQQAQMAMFREEKINPLGGCLPIVVQIPVFIALYSMLLESVELRQAPWIFWIQDLSIKDPYFVLPIIMGISMFVQQRLNPAPMDPMQAKVMMALPFVFTIFFLFFPSGLVIYWVVNSVLSIAQQWYITNKVVGKEN